MYYKGLDCKHEHDEACGYVPPQREALAPLAVKSAIPRIRTAKPRQPRPTRSRKNVPAKPSAPGKKSMGIARSALAEGAEIDKVCVRCSSYAARHGAGGRNRTDTGKAIQLGTSGIAGYDSAAGYDYIYFGSWTAQDTYTTSALSNGGFWTTRPTQGKPAFSCSPTDCLEQAIMAVYISITQARIATHGRAATRRRGAIPLQAVISIAGNLPQFWKPQKATMRLPAVHIAYHLPPLKNILNGDKVFFLSAEEAENSAYGFANDNARIANYGGSACAWWLRFALRRLYGRCGRGLRLWVCGLHHRER